MEEGNKEEEDEEKTKETDAKVEKRRGLKEMKSRGINATCTFTIFNGQIGVRDPST